MPFPRWASYSLLAAACGLAGFLGYRSALPGEASRISASSPNVESRPGHSLRERGRQESSKDRIERLRQLVKDGITTHASGREAWSIIQGLTQNEVQDELKAYGEAGKFNGDDMTGFMLCDRLAQLDPESALALNPVSDSKTLKVPYILTALTAWMRRDPERAVDWLVAHPGSGDSQGSAMIAKVFANLGIEKGLERIRSLPPEMVNDVISTFAAAASDTPESRQAILDNAFRSLSEKDAAKARSALMTAWGQQDPKSALAECSLEPSDHDNLQRILGRWARTDPAAAALWTIEHPDQIQDAHPEQTYRSLVKNAPENAPEVLAVLEKRPGFLESTVRSYQSDFMAGGWSPYGDDTSVTEKAGDAMRQHYQRWSQLHPEAAEAWRVGLPADVQAVLTSNPASSHAH